MNFRIVLIFWLQLKQKTHSLVILDSATSKEFNEIAISVYGQLNMKRENPYTGQRERVMDFVNENQTPTQFLT